MAPDSGFDSWPASLRPGPGFVDRLDDRILASVELPLQVRGAPHGRSVDPLRGCRVLLNSNRAGRPREKGSHCLFCRGETPPTLFYLEEEAGLRPGRPVVESEQESLDLVRRYRDSRDPSEPPDPWEALRLLASRTHPDAEGDPVPLVHPERPWLARTFLNFVPLLADTGSAANCFVVSPPPAYHHHDLGRLLGAESEGEASPILPPAVLEAVVRSWACLEAWSHARNLIPVPFINGGKSQASGQSLAHFHSQFYALGPDDEPPIYRRLAQARRSGCPVCALLSDEGLRVRVFGSVAVAVHPAPGRNLTFVVAPLEEQSRLTQLDAADFAEALGWAVRRWEVLLGGVPAYVVAVRTGDLVGHLHAEVVPRSHVNTPGGFEEATGFAVATRDPRAVARLLREA